MRYLPPWLQGDDENDVPYTNNDGGDNDSPSSSSSFLPSFFFFNMSQCYDTTTTYICTSPLLLLLFSPPNSHRCTQITSSLKTTIHTYTSKTMSEQLTILDGFISDVQVLLSLSIVLALMRVALVHMLVPRYLAPRRLAAFMRCKSTHLLSSSAYQFSPVMGGEGLR
eukprot:CAMPEP_0185726560 /NCGR_PEP_ID=MMETSP1171-20130828/2508_1 /TAXON_ID=374046 /ORGANISM="Helicotheca tamensis, Strain CCMP826" /LENGTH=166 /DNA_ID=CAMNT_0028394943 /DNA_START=746 /DNA_END=1243 /DNA_ORIENTATION=-